MKCTVTLDNGKSETITSKGELNLGAAGFGLFYEIDGDKCFLSYSNGTLTQERRGGVCMKMTFLQGKETDCYLGEGGLSGKFTVFTESVKIKNDGKSVEVALGYICAGEKITLHITAK